MTEQYRYSDLGNILRLALQSIQSMLSTMHDDPSPFHAFTDDSFTAMKGNTAAGNVS